MQADEGGGSQGSGLAKVTTSAAGIGSSLGKNSIQLDNVKKVGVSGQHAISGVMSDPSHQLAGLVGVDPDTANPISHIISGGREDEETEINEEESLARTILVSQHPHHTSKVEPLAQSRLSNLHPDSSHGVAALITANAGKEATIANSSSDTASLVVADMARVAASSSSLPIPASPVMAHHLSLLSAVDTAAISQMMQSGAARLSIVPGHPNTLALVPADNVSPSLGLVTGHDPNDLDTSEGHAHLGLDSEHLIMDRTTSSLEEDHEKLAQDKIQLHITTGKLLAFVELINLVLVVGFWKLIMNTYKLEFSTAFSGGGGGGGGALNIRVRKSIIGNKISKPMFY